MRKARAVHGDGGTAQRQKAQTGAVRWGRLSFGASLAAVIVAAAAIVTVFAVPRARSGPQRARPSGIPASITDAQINLTGLSPVRCVPR